MLTDLISHPILSIVILLGALVFIHELGHFLPAKIFGIGVETFSIGFGPVIISFKALGTLYQIAAIPLGGFVKLAGSYRGETVPPEYKGKELYRASSWKQFLILAGGPAFNVFLAIFIYMCMSLNGITKIDSVIGVVRKNSPAGEAGLLPGDKVTHLGGSALKSWDEMSELISSSPGKPIKLEFLRDGLEKSVVITPDPVKVLSHRGGKEEVGKIGIAPLFWLPIVTVEKESLSYLHGLRTGDSIEAYEYRVADVTESFSGKISAWHELLTLEKDLQRVKVKELILRVTRKVQEDEKKSYKIIIPGDGFFSNSSIIKSLGIHESELTFVKKPGTKVHVGLQHHDRLLSFNGKALYDIFDLEETLKQNDKESAVIGVRRDGVTKIFQVKLEPIERQMPSGKKTFYIFTLPFLGKGKTLPTRLEKAESLPAAVVFGVKKTYDMSVMMLESLWGLVAGRVPLAAISGPIAIAKVTSDSIKLGLEAFFLMMALISINLAIVNLLPIPILDGGRIVIVFIEWIRGKALSLEALENFQKIGFVFIFSLFILSTYNDLSRFWASMVRDFLGMIK